MTDEVSLLVVALDTMRQAFASEMLTILETLSEKDVASLPNQTHEIGLLQIQGEK
jgi:hypothetical protein